MLIHYPTSDMLPKPTIVMPNPILSSPDKMQTIRSKPAHHPHKPNSSQAPKRQPRQNPTKHQQHERHNKHSHHLLHPVPHIVCPVQHFAAFGIDGDEHLSLPSRGSVLVGYILYQRVPIPVRLAHCDAV